MVTKPVIRLDDAPMEEDEDEHDEQADEQPSSAPANAEVRSAPTTSVTADKSDMYHFGQQQQQQQPSAEESRAALRDDLDERDEDETEAHESDEDDGGMVRLTAEQQADSEVLLEEIKESFEEQYEDTDFDEVMVSEYRDEIFAYMAELEVRFAVSLLSLAYLHLVSLCAPTRLLAGRCDWPLLGWVTRVTSDTDASCLIGVHPSRSRACPTPPT